MSELLPAWQKICDSHQAAQICQIASPCHWFVPGHDSWSCLATLMLQHWQEELSHIFLAPLGASGYLLSAWTRHEILWSELEELSYLDGNYLRKMSVGWVCWSEWLPSHELMGRCRSRMVSGAGNSHLNVLWAVAGGKMLVPSSMWAEIQALCKRRAGHEGRSRGEQSRGTGGFW